MVQKLCQFSVQTTRLHNTVKFRDPMQEPDLLACKSKWYSCPCLSWQAQGKANGSVTLLESKLPSVTGTGLGCRDIPALRCYRQDFQCPSAECHIDVHQE